MSKPVIPNETGKNQTKFRFGRQNVKPFSYFQIIGRIILLLYSGYFFSNQILTYHDGIWYYVSFIILLFPPVYYVFYHAKTVSAKKSPEISEKFPEKILLFRKRIQTAYFLILFGMHIKICLIERFTVNGDSMKPALLSDESVWAEKITAGIPLPDLTFPFSHGIKKLLYGSFDYGEIVIFQYPGMTANSSEYFIKRIIALPGDHYRFTDDGIEINGKKLHENYLENPSFSFYTEDYQAPVFSIPDTLKYMEAGMMYSAMNGCGKYGTVPKDSLLLLGDNRKHSRDSRSVGFIPVSFIKGKILKRRNSER